MFFLSKIGALLHVQVPQIGRLPAVLRPRCTLPALPTCKDATPTALLGSTWVARSESISPFSSQKIQQLGTLFYRLQQLGTLFYRPVVWPTNFRWIQNHLEYSNCLVTGVNSLNHYCIYRLHIYHTIPVAIPKMHPLATNLVYSYQGLQGSPLWLGICGHRKLT